MKMKKSAKQAAIMKLIKKRAVNARVAGTGGMAVNARKVTNGNAVKWGK